MSYDYSIATSRNIGLLTEDEQEKLRTFTIAIPGMGGAGGSHLISLVRQGFERFKIADLDSFELKNFNRQYGARIDTIGRKKTEVMKEEALKINPNCQIEIFPDGISEENINLFLADVDLAVDALDAFEIDVRRLFLNMAHKKGIPSITAAPIGFGSAFLVFYPSGPSFDEYCSISDALSYDKKLVHFFVGLIPKMLQRPYMKRTSLKEKRGPSSIGAINLCSGVITIYAAMLLLKKGVVRGVPYYHHFDLMRGKFVSKKLWFGNDNPIQRVKIYLAEFLATD